MSASITAQRIASVASLANFQRAKSKAAQVAAAKAALANAHSAPKVVETAVQVVESAEHHAEALAASDALHRFQVAHAHATE
jgi:hypothetical protein